jgi:nitroreductase
MEIIDAIQSRKSIRGYKPDPVPREILEEIIGIATRSPSAMNTQPWEITVVTGEALDNIRRDNVEKLVSGVEPNADVPIAPFEGVYRQRQVDLAIQLFQLLGIAREDKEKRAEWMKMSPRYFNAPAAIFISVDSSMQNFPSPFDLGALSQTICLVALNYGLGTCIEGMGVFWPDVVKKYAKIPESKRLVMSIAIGYPDWDFPGNKLETQRLPLEDVVSWCGFD